MYSVINLLCIALYYLGLFRFFFQMDAFMSQNVGAFSEFTFRHLRQKKQQYYNLTCLKYPYATLNDSLQFTSRVWLIKSLKQT